MGVWNGTKKVAGHFFNFRVDKWVAYHYLKDTLNYILFILRSLAKPEQTQIEESFQEAVVRLQLEPEDLKKRAKQLKHWCFLFLGIALGLLLYTVYIFKQSNWMGTAMTLALMIYALYQAFRFHFWHYQLVHERLGCTLKESLSSLSPFKENP